MTRRFAAKQQRNRPAATPGRLRIVAGIWRSRVLGIADVENLRPTPERVRETLFNWLTPSIAGARCLDLYAGTGALGLEALSREAGEVVFVEKSRKAVDMLKTNVQTLDARGAVIRHGDALDYLRATPDPPFDVVFLDPPFADDRLAELCRLIEAGGLLAPGGQVYLEDDKLRDEPRLPDGWQVLKQKVAGNVRYALVIAGREAVDKRS